jgi:hypothetical protein
VIIAAFWADQSRGENAASQVLLGAERLGTRAAFQSLLENHNRTVACCILQSNLGKWNDFQWLDIGGKRVRSEPEQG